MLNVLIVEDDLTIAELLQETLEADGYHVTGIARTVSEALKLAKQTEPDIALSLTSAWRTEILEGMWGGIYGRKLAPGFCSRRAIAAT